MTEEILEEMIELSKSYTPMWRLHKENPDAGTALALIFAEMLHDTQQKLDLLFQKNEIAFFNMQKADMMSAKASKGYVTFDLVNEEVPGVFVDTGTKVVAPAIKDHPESSFEVSAPLYVTPARIDCIYQVSDRYDSICTAKQISDQWAFHAFFAEDNNLQCHEIYLSHTNLFQINTEGYIEIQFLKCAAKQLADQTMASFSYYSENGSVEFESVREEDGKIILKKGEEQPPFALTMMLDIESCWIRLQIKNAHAFKNMNCHGILLNAYTVWVPPLAIHGDDAGIQCDPVEYRPFGKKMGMYREVLFGSDEVLSKSGARARLRFRLEFEKVPLETGSVHKINWNWKMKESDFEKEPEYEISIHKVIWEYHSRKGWKRLFRDNSYEDVFCFNESTSFGYQDISFQIPDDISPTVENSIECCYIRARILEMNNEYKTNGYYMTPMLSDTALSFTYQDRVVLPQYVGVKHNLQQHTYKGTELGDHKQIPLAKQMNTEGTSIYLGFRSRPEGSPLKILFRFSKNQQRIPYPLKWEYCNLNGFGELDVTDETKNFQKTGIVTFTGPEDMQKKTLFGQEQYWIRITDIHNYYENSGCEMPYITGIFMNTTKAVSCDFHSVQKFCISEYEIGRKLKLMKEEVLSVRLWVNEGTEEENWVLWEQVEDFLDSGARDCHYVFDAYHGVITFGNGIHGKVPPVSDSGNVLVEFKTGGGSSSNIEKYRINRLKKSMGFIRRVTNHVEFLGGCDRETQPESIERNCALLKHQNKAVTVRDYEEIAKECSNGIHKVKCFPHIDESGQQKEGALTLCVIQKELEKSHLSFEELKEQLRTYIRERAGLVLVGGMKLYIVSPILLKIHLFIKAQAQDYTHVFEQKKEMEQRLDMFLHPLYGNTTKEGFEIGEVPDEVQIKNVLYMVKGIVAIPLLRLNYELYSQEERVMTDLETVQNTPFLLTAGGVHHITVEVERSGAYVEGY